MKKQLLSLMLPIIAIASTQNTHAANAVGSTSMLAYAPLMSVSCAAYGGKDETCQGAYIFGASATLTTVLLKEVKAVQPDALDYVAGAAPSPALYEVVEKVQQLVFEQTGMDVTFDEAVNEIVANI